MSNGAENRADVTSDALAQHQGEALRPADDIRCFLADQTLVEVLIVAYPHDTGLGLLSTCTALWCDEHLMRALVRSLNGPVLLAALCASRSASSSRLSAVLSVTPSKHLSTAKNGKTPLEHALASSSVHALRALGEHSALDWRVVLSGEFEGHTPFTLACKLAMEDATDNIQLAAALECARFLLSLRGPDGQPVFGPTDILAKADEAGPMQPRLKAMTLYWACRAGLVDEVKAWVASDAILDWFFCARVMDGHTCFAAILQDPVFETGGSRSEDARACLSALAAHMACLPHTHSLARRAVRHLDLACEAGMDTVVQVWADRGLLTKEAVQHVNLYGASAFARACDAAARMHTPSALVQSSTKQGAVAHEPVAWFCWGRAGSSRVSQSAVA